MFQPGLQGRYPKTTSAMRGRDIIANVSNIVGEEVGVDMVPHTYDTDDCTLATDQPAVGTGDNTDEPFSSFCLP